MYVIVVISTVIVIVDVMSTAAAAACTVNAVASFQLSGPDAGKSDNLFSSEQNLYT